MGEASAWGRPPCIAVTGSALLRWLGSMGDGWVRGRAGDAVLPMSRGSQNLGGEPGDSMVLHGGAFLGAGVHPPSCLEEVKARLPEVTA